MQLLSKISMGDRVGVTSCLPKSCRSLLKCPPSAPWPVAAYKFSMDCKEQSWFNTDHRALSAAEGNLCSHSDLKLLHRYLFSKLEYAAEKLTLLFSVGSRESSVLLSTSPISSSDTLGEETQPQKWVKVLDAKQFLKENGWKEEEDRALCEIAAGRLVAGSDDDRF